MGNCDHKFRHRQSYKIDYGVTVQTRAFYTCDWCGHIYSLGWEPCANYDDEMGMCDLISRDGQDCFVGHCISDEHATTEPEGQSDG